MEGINLLNEALMQYGMPDAKSELIRHNENMTYCIDGKYLLRIHKPKAGFNTTSYYKDADIVRIHESELNFIEHLQECGVYVQSTIRNVDNKLVSVLSDGTVVTMLTWISGRIVNKNDLTEEFGYKLGKMTAKMHIAAQGYHADNFIRYDRNLCQRLIDLLSSYFINGKLEKRYYYAMSSALELIGDRLKQTEPEHILLHSDLSLSNILVTDNGLVPIDFSLLGYSNPMLDFGSIYCFVNNEECRIAAIKGYEETRGCKVDKREIGYYFALQILLGIALHYELWIGEDWFAKRLPQWCNETFIPLADN